MAREASAQEELHAKIRHLVAGVAAELRSALRTNLTRERYETCVVRNEPCGSDFSDAINYAIDMRHWARRIGGDEFRAWLGARAAGDPQVRGALLEMLGTEGDSLDRISAHLFLRYGAEFEFTPLPARAYAGIAQRTVVEADLVAEWHRGHAVSTEVTDEFVALSTTEDLRGRRAAWVTLGHEETANALAEALLGANLDSGDWNTVALAVTSCGLPCLESATFLMSRGDPAARIAFYEALTWAPDLESRRQLAELAVAAAPEGIDESELETRARFIHDAVMD